MGSTSYVFERYFRYALYGYMISRILVDQPRGEFKIPRTAPQASGSSQDLQVKYSSVFNHICMHGTLKNIFRDHTYKEIDNSISEFLNEDWQLFP